MAAQKKKKVTKRKKTTVRRRYTRNSSVINRSNIVKVTGKSKRTSSTSRAGNVRNVININASPSSSSSSSGGGGQHYIHHEAPSTYSNGVSHPEFIPTPQFREPIPPSIPIQASSPLQTSEAFPNSSPASPVSKPKSRKAKYPGGNPIQDLADTLSRSANTLNSLDNLSQAASRRFSRPPAFEDNRPSASFGGSNADNTPLGIGLAPEINAPRYRTLSTSTMSSVTNDDLIADSVRNAEFGNFKREVDERLAALNQSQNLRPPNTNHPNLLNQISPETGSSLAPPEPMSVYTPEPSMNSFKTADAGVSSNEAAPLPYLLDPSDDSGSFDSDKVNKTKALGKLLENRRYRQTSRLKDNMIDAVRNKQQASKALNKLHGAAEEHTLSTDERREIQANVVARGFRAGKMKGKGFDALRRYTENKPAVSENDAAELHELREKSKAINKLKRRAETKKLANDIDTSIDKSREAVLKQKGINALKGNVYVPTIPEFKNAEPSASFGGENSSPGVGAPDEINTTEKTLNPGSDINGGPKKIKVVRGNRKSLKATQTKRPINPSPRDIQPPKILAGSENAGVSSNAEIAHGLLQPVRDKIPTKGQLVLGLNDIFRQSGFLNPEPSAQIKKRLDFYRLQDSTGKKRSSREAELTDRPGKRVAFEDVNVGVKRKISSLENDNAEPNPKRLDRTLFAFQKKLSPTVAQSGQLLRQTPQKRKPAVSKATILGTSRKRQNTNNEEVWGPDYSLFSD